MSNEIPENTLAAPDAPKSKWDKKEKVILQPNERFMDGDVELYVLTEEQKQVAWENRTMGLKALTQLVFGDKEDKLDGRSMEGRSIKFYLSGKGVELKTTGSSMEKVELTDDQKEQIEALAHTFDNVLEIAQALFPKETIKPMSNIYRAVWAHYKEVFPDGVDRNEEVVEERYYKPPQNFNAVLALANRYVTTDDLNRKAYNPNTLRISDERNIKGLSRYIRVYTFAHAANQFDKAVDRELFISTFVRWAHDKPDLTQIEVDQMINAAKEQVNITQIERSIQRIDKIHEQIVEGNEVDDQGRKRKLGIADVELINSMRTKLDQSKGRLKDLMATLETSRSKRLSEKDNRNATVLDLFDAWQTDEQKRKDMIEIAKREKEDEKREVGRLRDLDDLVAIVSGQTEEEASA